jgi:hypothetical protein
MSNTVEGHHEMNLYEKDNVEMKSDIKILEKQVSDLKSTTIRHEEQITTLNKTLKKIDENTTWIKRKITGAIITAIAPLSHRRSNRCFLWFFKTIRGNVNWKNYYLWTLEPMSHLRLSFM